ncbi:MAG: PEP-CTERM sorting domain-containing protein [Bdellovibrionales bacterium]|nr:PEP-CTERM sorting domain-containing protein [Bdellovibrionales bacterium]
MNFRNSALLFAACSLLLLPASALAVPFKYDTKYDLSGSFSWRNASAEKWGTLTVQEGSHLYYDSAEQSLTLDVQLRASNPEIADLVFDMDFFLGAANPKDAVAMDGAVELTRRAQKVEFDYVPGAMVKGGRTHIGTFTIPEHILLDEKKAKRGPWEEGDYMIFAKNMNPHIFLKKGELVFQAWTGIWSNDWDLHADPQFRLTESSIPPTEVPEPFTVTLLGSGLLAAAGVRRRKS